MSLFVFGKKKPEKPRHPESPIKVLGSGCTKCNQLEEATTEALKTLGIQTPVDHVSEFAEIAAYGVMTTPALVIDGQVVSSGKVLKPDEIVKLITKIRS